MLMSGRYIYVPILNLQVLTKMADANGVILWYQCLKWTTFITFIVILLSKESSSLICYCSGMCPGANQLNGTCLARPRSKCFSAVEQVVDPVTGQLENERTYGCMPPEERGFMQCKGHLVPHQIPKSIQCCSGKDLCNKYLEPALVIRPTTVSPMYNGELMTYTGPYHLVVFVAAVTVCFVILAVVVICMILKMKNQKDSRRPYLDVERCKGVFGRESIRDPIDNNNSSGSGSGAPLLVQRTIGKQVEMVSSIGKGRFGEVWKGLLRDEFVAVKIFFTSEEASWARETDIYKTVLLRHENILGFIAADIKGSGSWAQMLLITDYHELGSLHDYLKVHMLDLTAALRLCYSVACGLSHLHVEIFGKQGKPAIAHRDIKSRNILVKKDRTCAIGDFGLAVKFKSDINELDIATNTRVGTKRYMAPEVLDESIDVTQFEAYKMADMYSFALVLWEIIRRCIINGIVEDYQLPYAEYVPSNPSLEDMKKVVCVDQSRPTIPKHWSNCRTMEVLCKIIQEMWKQNPGARLSALRVKKTLSKLNNKHKEEKFV